MKPFLILQLRKLDDAADSEFYAILNYGGLSTQDVVRVRMEKSGIPKINLENYSGVVVGGGPTNISDSNDKKSPEELRFEKQLFKLIEEVLERDMPFLGTCYGLGALGKVLGAKVGKEKFHESAGTTHVSITKDHSVSITSGVAYNFTAFTGHKESWQDVPAGVDLIGTSDNCLVQMVRVKENVFGTQFHTELDLTGLKLRLKLYLEHGYFDPKDYEHMLVKYDHLKITEPQKILSNFVRQYHQK